jgi:hypothetical protein
MLFILLEYKNIPRNYKG